MEHVQKGEVQVAFVRSDDMVAGMVTKNLSSQKFLPTQRKLKMQ